MTQLKYRQAEYEYRKEKRVRLRVAYHRSLRGNPNVAFDSIGRAVLRKQQAGRCPCGNIFTATITTKKHIYCAACKVARAKARDAGRSRG